MQHSCLKEHGLKVLITDFPTLNLFQTYFDGLNISAESVEFESSKLHKLIPNQTSALSNLLGNSNSER